MVWLHNNIWSLHPFLTYSEATISEINNADFPAAKNVTDGLPEATGSRPPLGHHNNHRYKSESPRRNHSGSLLFDRDVKADKLDKVKPSGSELAAPRNDEEGLIRTQSKEDFTSSNETSEFSVEYPNQTGPRECEESENHTTPASVKCYRYTVRARLTSYPRDSILVSETSTIDEQEKPRLMDFVGPSKTVLIQKQRQGTDLPSTLKPFYYNVEFEHDLN